MVKITETAAKEIKNIIQKSKDPQKNMLRIYFAGYGWGGPKLNVTLDGLSDEKDKLVESEGIKIVYDADLEEYLQNSVVDYSSNWFEKGFVIRGAGVSTC
jgi:iron-sulfur cluster assembly accessory protein